MRTHAAPDAQTLRPLQLDNVIETAGCRAGSDDRVVDCASDQKSRSPCGIAHAELMALSSRQRPTLTLGGSLMVAVPAWVAEFECNHICNRAARP